MATDMARHMTDLNEIKELIEQVPKGTAILPEGLADDERERRRTMMMCNTLHLADISFLARPFEAQQIQCYLLFEEFFN